MIFAAVMVGVLQAQTSSQVMIPQRGVVPAGFYGASDLETIDSVSGNLLLKIPLASFPAGRTGTTAGVGLIYNSSIYGWQGTRLQNSDIIDPLDSGGWHYNYQYTFTTDYIPPSDCFNTQLDAAYWRYRLITPDGSSHVLYILGRSDDSPSGYYPYHDPNCQPGAFQTQP